LTSLFVHKNYEFTWLGQVADNGTYIVGYAVYLDYATEQCKELTV